MNTIKKHIIGIVTVLSNIIIISSFYLSHTPEPGLEVVYMVTAIMCTLLISLYFVSLVVEIINSLKQERIVEDTHTGEFEKR